MVDKFTIEQLKASKKYGKYGYILDTELQPGVAYALYEIDRKLAKYINKE